VGSPLAMYCGAAELLHARTRIFGVTEFFDGGEAVGRTVVASKTARYVSIPFAAVREAGLREPELFIALGAVNAQQNRSLTTTIASHVSKPTLARVASALLPYAVPARGLERALPPLAQMTQSQVAAAAGTVKEVAARAIAELERTHARSAPRTRPRPLPRSLEAFGNDRLALAG